ncbi:MAG: hypothetical protein JRN15_24190, partial [Nitrososphaerota archaeon]|nr:hypothetical protein [Nitrososphaerota archaeon]
MAFVCGARDAIVKLAWLPDKTAAILSNGQTLSDVFVANLTGAPGSYNSSASGANFIFAGTEQSVASQAASINIF